MLTVLPFSLASWRFQRLANRGPSQKLTWPILCSDWTGGLTRDDVAHYELAWVRTASRSQDPLRQEPGDSWSVVEMKTKVER